MKIKCRKDKIGGMFYRIQASVMIDGRRRRVDKLSDNFDEDVVNRFREYYPSEETRFVYEILSFYYNIKKEEYHDKNRM